MRTWGGTVRTESGPSILPGSLQELVMQGPQTVASCLCMLLQPTGCGGYGSRNELKSLGS